MGRFKPCDYAYLRGQILPIKKAQISIMTNSLHYGCGIFGGLKIINGPRGFEIFRLHDHLERMNQSCRLLHFPFELDYKQITDVIKTLANKNKLKSTTYVRPIIYRSDTDLSPGITGEYDIAIYMLEMTKYLDSTNGVNVCVSSWQRNSDRAIPPKTKATGGYLNSALAIHDAISAGYDSAIFLDKNDNVSEGAVMNIFLVKNGELITPDAGSDILEGITRRTLLELARKKIHVQERKVSRKELYTADEIFFCGTAVEIAWCRSVDGIEISSKQGSITHKLEEDFRNLPKTHPELFTPVT